MESSLPVKAKVISSSRCTLSDAAAFLNEYIRGNSRADPMVQGYLQNVCHEIEGMISRRKCQQDAVSPRKHKLKGGGQQDSEMGFSGFQINDDVSCLQRKVLGCNELGLEERPPLRVAAGGPENGSVLKKSLSRSAKRKLLDDEGIYMKKSFQEFGEKHSKEDKLSETVESIRSKKKRSKEEKSKGRS